MAHIYEEEHEIFRSSVKKFLEREVLPYVDHWEQRFDYPSEIYQKLGAQGFLGILVPEEWGGVGGDYTLASAWCEEFGRVPSVGFTTGVNMHSVVVTSALARLGTPEAKEKWLRRAVEGTAIGAYAFTEPGFGSDLSRIQTKAVADGAYYVINGAKTFITNGARAHFILLLTRTDSSAGYGGFTTFVVDTSLPGFSVSRKLSKIGWHASDTAELSFTDMRVHRSMTIGEINRGWYRAMESLEWERLMLSLNAIGGSEACLERTITYVNDRKVFGRSVGSYDHTRDMLATLWSKLQAAKAMVHRCVRMINAGERCRREVSLAKIYTCELAIVIADRCLQLHGGYGYTTEFLPERWLRDLRLNTIGGGTSEVMASIAAREMGLSTE